MPVDNNSSPRDRMIAIFAILFGGRLCRNRPYCKTHGSSAGSSLESQPHVLGQGKTASISCYTHP